LLLYLYSKCPRVGQSGVILIINRAPPRTPRIRIVSTTTPPHYHLKRLVQLKP